MKTTCIVRFWRIVSDGKREFVLPPCSFYVQLIVLCIRSWEICNTVFTQNKFHKDGQTCSVSFSLNWHLCKYKTSLRKILLMFPKLNKTESITIKSILKIFSENSTKLPQSISGKEMFCKAAFIWGFLSTYISFSQRNGDLPIRATPLHICKLYHSTEMSTEV